MATTPGCVERSELCRRAYGFAFGAHEGPDGAGGTEIAHPVAVAGLLDEAGYGEEVVAAAFLHDVVEDTERDLEEIGMRFGPVVCRLVAAMTEDASIPRYEDRKDEHRHRVLAAGPDPATIYAADKLARIRALRAAGDPVDPKRLAHYRATLELFSAERPGLPFLEQIAAELPELEAANEREAG